MKTERSETILVTGAAGFIGRRLVDELLRRGYRVRCMVRRTADLPAGTEQIRGDLLQPDSLPTVLEGVAAAYYLVHSMGARVILPSRIARQPATLLRPPMLPG
jgi:uncharacterized protein YbjT (DUF2867 family)